MVWKDLRARRIGKSLEKELGLGVISRDNGSSWWCTHVQQRLKSMMSRHMYMAWWPYGG